MTASILNSFTESAPQALKASLIVIAAVSSIVSFVFCVVDKRRAVKHASRISEASLILASSFGGALVMYLTMLAVRHKTKHKKFMAGLPLMILFHAAIAYLVYFV
ncbi:MAG: DUF1294 domain-containing protein [Clostridia bacterium]|nr:DUF1294 domain-containing protein [Clostridia bacterium]